MLTEQEKRIVKDLKAKGYTESQVLSFFGANEANRFNSTIHKDEKKQQEVQDQQNQSTFERISQGAEKFTDAIGLGGAVDTFGSIIAANQNPDVANLIDLPTNKQALGAVGQTAALTAGTLVTGGSSLAGQIAAGAGLGYLYDVSSDLVEGKTGNEILMPGGATVVGAALPPILRGAGNLLRPLTQGAARTAGGPAREVATEVATNAAKQVEPTITPLQRVAREYAVNRPSRLLQRAEEAITEQRDLAKVYQTATPEVRNAIDSNLDMRIVNTVSEADDATKQGYRQIVDIAEQGKGKIGVNQRPEIVAGNAAADQYKLIDTKRKEVGAEIGKVVDSISQTERFNARPLYDEIDSLLKNNGIVPEYTEKGVKLNFAGSNLTDKQRTAVQQLYNVMTETGDVVTPRQLYNKDNLLSQLQRETRFDGVSDIYVKNAEGQDINLFGGLRRIVSEELEGVAPEIKSLNKEYRQLRTLQDDIESSIFKSGKFEGSKGVDPAEFAQTNLRRLFSDAQSAADYRAIYNNLDAYSRALGYEGARADDLAAFAVEMRKLYPDSIPPTSATGIFGGVVDTAKALVGAGKANITDQQRALKQLLGNTNSPQINNEAFGAIAGVQVDENGNVTFDPTLAAAGFGAMTASQKKRALNESLSNVNKLIEKTTNKTIQRQYAKARDLIKRQLRDI